MTTQPKPIGITLGDPAGIGPEISLAALLSLPESDLKRIRVFGTQATLERAAATLKQSIPKNLQLHSSNISSTDVQMGSPTKEAGIEQTQTLLEAIRCVKEEDFAGLVTAPIHKACARLGGFKFPGHTECLADAFEADVAMMFIGPRLSAVLATTHLPLNKVPTTLTKASIVRVGSLALDTLKNHKPISRVGVLGLNPHAGEGGLFGHEDEDIIAPAISELRKSYPEVTFSDPLPPDSAFRSDNDFFIAMYHDQALIPIKLLDFDNTVHCTLGLPIIRTSPDHGVAYDIAGKGIARSESMLSAIQMCLSLTTP